MRNLLQRSLQLRDRYQEGEISEHGWRTATGRLEAKLDRMLEKRYRHPGRLTRHLEHERGAGTGPARDRTQQILVNVLRTCWQQGKGALFTPGVVVALAGSRDPRHCASRGLIRARWIFT